MKRKLIFVLGILIIMMFPVNSQQEISVAEYQQEIQDLIDDYGEEFDKCFSDLSSDFPTLPDEYLDIDKHIKDLSVNEWYHRKIPFMMTEIDEIVIHLEAGDTEYLIRVTYLYNEEESKFVIYSVNFFDNVAGSVEGDFWNVMTIPFGISKDSLREIDVCMGTPGFMIMTFIIALTIAFVIYSKKINN
jgi:hypothetical protein